MGLFKLRKPGATPAAPGPAAPAETIEAMRRRARQRLIGAAVLVLAGVVGFPLLFDTKPRAVAVDIPIEIPDRNKARTPAPAAPPAAVSGRVTQDAKPAADAPAAAPPPAASPPAPPPEPAATAVAAAPPQAPRAIKSPPPAAAAPAPPPVAATPAPAASPTATTVEGRYVVQVGAYAEAERAREARAKLERAGLKTYTHVADTKDGKRIRVRVGPFPTKAEADKAAQKVKGLDLPAAVLTLS